MTTSPALDLLTILLTPLQCAALLEIVERADVKGSDAPLVTGILRALAQALDEESA